MEVNCRSSGLKIPRRTPVVSIAAAGCADVDRQVHGGQIADRQGSIGDDAEERDRGMRSSSRLGG
jgi:hypothetical protein